MNALHFKIMMTNKRLFYRVQSAALCGVSDRRIANNPYPEVVGDAALCLLFRRFAPYKSPRNHIK